MTKEALKTNDGKEVPLIKEPGGPVIGTAKFHWVEETGVLEAEFQIDDPLMAEFLQDLPPNLYGK